ncbi:hypothetical protein IK112_03530 [Candidatus Saccharibacteria bacterium]|nr:hypothetical protein [Candidatus Saccharibacteria bacterium]
MSEKLTASFINKLDPKNVIYAEYAHSGAMGNVGGMMFYVLEDGNLNLYETNIFKHQADYEAGCEFLQKNEDLFCKMNGGFGNLVFVLADSKLEDDSNSSHLVYKKDGKRYCIESSVLGVYMRIHEQAVMLSSFPRAKQRVRLLEQEKGKKEAIFKSFDENKLRKIAGKSLDDFRFLKAVFEFLNDIYMQPLLTVPYLSSNNWEDAINYIMIRNNEAFNFGANMEICDKEALWGYRLKYAVEKLGFYPFFNIVDDFVLEKNPAKDRPHLLDVLDEAAGEKIKKKFSKIEVVNPKINLQEEFDFNYPRLVRYTISEDEEIIKSIIQRKYNDIKTTYYFKNYLHFKDEKALSKIVPAAFFVIATTDDARAFLAAGDVINAAWVYITDPKEEREYQKIIYKAFWDRVKSLWPIDNYELFTFKNKDLEEIFEDSVGWLKSIDILEELNPVLNNSVREFEKRECYNPDKAKRKLINDLADIKTLDKANTVLDGIFSGKSEVDDTLWLLERILLNCKPEKVGAHIIRRTTKEYHEETPIWMFTAACEGATNKDELPELEKFGRKLINAGESKKIIQAAMQVAEKNVAIAEFQRKTLKNFKKEFVICAKYEDEKKHENSRH